ncbi:MAG TPA: alpha-glucosidase/alpha-galactosidase [Thermomicrobiales bacterium]|nr:alpha-glucosidase/alpha-galactosidase [Thermomicrobiales bacterium]
MAKIAFIGAGSTVFARNLLKDLFTFPELHDSTVHLMDIDPDRLRDSETVARRVAAEAGASPTIETTTDRRGALRGADYVINMIQVGGYRPATVTDFEIPKKYGLRQTIGDTLGIGGIMRGLRTIPVLLDIARDMEELCPDALLLNYSNPMAMLTWALNAGSGVKTVGLCHSVFGTAGELAHILNIPVEEIDYLCAGINHMAFYLRFEHKGEDLYPRLKAIAAADEYPSYERVRQEVLKRFGYAVTESSEHFSEYTPWFIKQHRPDLIEHFRVPLDEYPARCEDQIADWTSMRAALVSDDPTAVERYEDERRASISGMAQRRLAVIERDDPQEAARMRARYTAKRVHQMDASHSGEYGTLIIHSMETGQPRVVYGNVGNNGSIANLPADCAVEVPCLVDRNGVQATHVGALPPQLAAMMQTNINVQRLTVEAALTGKREHIYHAAMLDPHTAAELDLDQITHLVDDLIEAHGDLMPVYT